MHGAMGAAREWSGQRGARNKAHGGCDWLLRLHRIMRHLANLQHFRGKGLGGGLVTRGHLLLPHHNVLIEIKVQVRYNKVQVQVRWWDAIDVRL